MSATANIAGLKIGADHPVRIVGVINVSPESFYKGSVQNKRTIQRAAREIEEQGADVVDIGAMSTAPYLETQISEKEEAERIAWAVTAVRAAVKIPISIDSSRPRPALEGLNSGADILNDITGLSAGPSMHTPARRASGLILMAHPSALNGSMSASPVSTIRNILESGMARARDAGVSAEHLVIDPGIGFFRNMHLEWWKWDIAILRDLRELTSLPAPHLVGVSRKSFISQILDGRAPEERLHGSLAATVVAVVNGASMIRTHDVAATREAVRVAQAIMVERIGFRTPAPVVRGPKGRKKTKA